eukprot:CAMPEP_0119085974 /NCGR_PEP_ID=MMETSP1178-20130426/135959_1 /TAXON_ID=33656 /ORGANISM="unid sp, Strain CCMP2000" /LENGTH=37 /DNA_ID= /DNA_START= /DNA_END= /DNA_ORIENTATION=
MLVAAAAEPKDVASMDLTVTAVPSSSTLTSKRSCTED